MVFLERIGQVLLFQHQQVTIDQRKLTDVIIIFWFGHTKAQFFLSDILGTFSVLGKLTHMHIMRAIVVGRI